MVHNIKHKACRCKLHFSLLHSSTLLLPWWMGGTHHHLQTCNLHPMPPLYIYCKRAGMFWPPSRLSPGPLTLAFVKVDFRSTLQRALHNNMSNDDIYLTGDRLHMRTNDLRLGTFLAPCLNIALCIPLYVHTCTHILSFASI